MARKNHEGNVRQKSNGRFELQVATEPDIYGNRGRKSFSGATESECRKKYKQWLKTGGEQQKPKKSKEHTLSSLQELWLQNKEGSVTQGTYMDYTGLVSHVTKSKLGSMRLSEIKPIHITEFFKSKAEYSHSFHKRMRFLLRTSFEFAIENDFCTKNPVKKEAVIKKELPEKKEGFSEDQKDIILEFAKTDKLFGLPAYIMLNTGIRPQEMRALTVDKIDLDRGVIIIDTAVKRCGKLGSTKSRKPRTVPIKPEVVEELSKRLDKKGKFIVGGNSYVSREGLRSRYNCFFKRLNKHLASIGAEPIDKKSPHSFRHTFGTLCHKNGMPMAVVSELLGHHSTDVTDKYVNLGNAHELSEAVNKYGL